MVVLIRSAMVKGCFMLALSFKSFFPFLFLFVFFLLSFLFYFMFVCFFLFLTVPIMMILVYSVVVEGSFSFFPFLFRRVILKSLVCFNSFGNDDSCLFESYFLYFNGYNNDGSCLFSGSRGFFFFFFLLFCRVILKSLLSFNGSGNGDSCLLENYFLFFLMASIMEILVCLMVVYGCFIFTSDFKITCFF